MNYCAECDTLYYGDGCEEHGSPARSIAPWQNPHPDTGTRGKLVLYQWPNGEESVVMILDDPDEDGNVGVALLSENRRVQPTDVRPFPETEET